MKSTTVLYTQGSVGPSLRLCWWSRLNGVLWTGTFWARTNAQEFCVLPRRRDWQEHRFLRIRRQRPWSAVCAARRRLAHRRQPSGDFLGLVGGPNAVDKTQGCRVSRLDELRGIVNRAGMQRAVFVADREIVRSWAAGRGCPWRVPWPLCGAWKVCEHIGARPLRSRRRGTEVIQSRLCCRHPWCPQGRRGCGNRQERLVQGGEGVVSIGA
jgi:hypothetical protein